MTNDDKWLCDYMNKWLKWIKTHQKGSLLSWIKTHTVCSWVSSDLKMFLHFLQSERLSVFLSETNTDKYYCLCKIFTLLTFEETSWYLKFFLCFFQENQCNIYLFNNICGLVFVIVRRFYDTMPYLYNLNYLFFPLKLIKFWASSFLGHAWCMKCKCLFCSFFCSCSFKYNIEQKYMTLILLKNKEMTLTFLYFSKMNRRGSELNSF